MRRWFRYSLRTFLLLMTVLGIWIGFQSNAARQQRAAVKAILDAGGNLDFDYQETPIPPSETALPALDANAPPPGPSWLRNSIGDDYFRNVIDVTLKNSSIKESDWARIAHLSHLKVAAFYDVQIVGADGLSRPIRDSDLSILAGLHGLVQLTVQGGQIDGPGLKYIPNPQGLKSFGLKNSPNCNFDMRYLAPLTGLKFLSLTGTQIPDDGMAYLEPLHKLTALSLIDTNVSDAGIKHIDPTSMRILFLRNTRVGDTCMAHIGTMSNLETLFLDRTLVTDAGLCFLGKLSKLKTLTLAYTKVTSIDCLQDLSQLQVLELADTKVPLKEIREFKKHNQTVQINNLP